jgi:hypothetical protein
MSQPEHDHRFSDSANRASDSIRLHILGKSAGKWAAIRLSDGGSDGTVYDSKRDAISHQIHETQCMYVKIPWDDFPPLHAERLLKVHRDLYAAGFRLQDPDGERDFIVPYTREDLRAFNIFGIRQ